MSLCAFVLTLPLLAFLTATQLTILTIHFGTKERRRRRRGGEHVQSRVRWSKDRAETEAAEVGERRRRRRRRGRRKTEVEQRRRRDRNASHSGIATVKHPFYKTQAEQGQREVTTVHWL